MIQGALGERCRWHTWLAKRLRLVAICPFFSGHTRTSARATPLLAARPSVLGVKVSYCEGAFCKTARGAPTRATCLQRVDTKALLSGHDLMGVSGMGLLATRLPGQGNLVFCTGHRPRTVLGAVAPAKRLLRADTSAFFSGRETVPGVLKHARWLPPGGTWRCFNGHWQTVQIGRAKRRTRLPLGGTWIPCSGRRITGLF